MVGVCICSTAGAGADVWNGWEPGLMLRYNRNAMDKDYEVRRTEAGEWVVELPVPACMGGADEAGCKGLREAECRKCESRTIAQILRRRAG